MRIGAVEIPSREIQLLSWFEVSYHHRCRLWPPNGVTLLFNKGSRWSVVNFGHYPIVDLLLGQTPTAMHLRRTRHHFTLSWQKPWPEVDAFWLNTRNATRHSRRCILIRHAFWIRILALAYILDDAPRTFMQSILHCFENILLDVSVIFYFFLFWGGGREEAFEEVAGGGPVLRKNRGRGGGSEEEAREGEGRRGSVCGDGGGAQYFFSGPKCPPRYSRFAATVCGSKTTIFFMQLHLPSFFFWGSFQYAFAAFKIVQMIYFMHLQFWRFSEKILLIFFWGGGGYLLIPTRIWVQVEGWTAYRRN